MIESDYQRLLLLEAPKRLPHVRLFRRNVGAVKAAVGADGAARWTRFGIPGQSDLWAVVRGGYIIEIEIKGLAGSLSPVQRAWRDFCLGWGVPWLLLKPLKGEAPEATVARWIGDIERLSCSR